MRFSTLEITVLALFIIAVIAAAVGPSLLRDRTMPEVTVSIKVGKDDTLWEIAAAHRVAGVSTAETVTSICELNGMAGGSIAAGQLLVVPATQHADAVVASR
ncbi:MAG: LysM peptidoglycan-binding domain-containing protein [Coriobacteriia bacterium]|nr:LysM peptidoglycan-binding domain-containing protein [Coriobacteriia bacterium]